MRKYSKEFKVGVIALLSGVILYFGVRFLKGIDMFSSTYTYYAIYEDIDGLQTSNSVVLQGYTIGRVSEIAFVQEIGKIVVSLDIDNSIEISKGSSALLMDDGLLGGKVISLDMNASKNFHGEGDTLKSDVNDGMMASIQEVASPILNELDKTIASVNLMLDSLNDMTGDFKTTMSNASSITGQVDNLLRRNSRDIDLMLDSLKSLSGNLALAGQEMPAMMNNLNSFSYSLKQMPLEETLETAQNTLVSLKATLDGINKGEGSVGKLMKDDSLYTSLNTSLLSLDTLLTDMQRNPKRYVHFSLFGRKNNK